MRTAFELVGTGYTDTGQVPKGKGLFYYCDVCGGTVSSVPRKSEGCQCRNIFIDKDAWRLIVQDFSRFSVLRQTSNSDGVLH